jgi:hypothetical protein
MVCRFRHPRIVATVIAVLCATSVGHNLAPCTSAERDGAVQVDETKQPNAAATHDRERRDTIQLQVRVVDTAGRPLPNATARVIVLTHDQKFETETITFNKSAELAVDADGKLLTPPLEFDKAYVLQVDAPGMLSALSRWTRPVNKGTTKLPDVVLRHLLTATGSVVTRDNKPIAGAIVTQSGDGPQRTHATTDEKGRFEIAGVPEQSAFLFAEKTGFAFHGQAVAAEQGPVQIVLERTDDPKRRTLRSLPPPNLGLTRAERLDLAFQVLKPRLDHRLSQKPPQPDFWLMRELAYASLPAALDYLDVLVAAGVSESERDHQIDEIATAIVIADPTEALALVQRISNPDERASVLSYLSIQHSMYARRTPADDILSTDRIIAETAFAARNAANPSGRVVELGEIATKLARRGKSAEAANLLDEAQEGLEGLDPDGQKWHFARIAAIRALVDTDPAAAQIAAIPKDASFWWLYVHMQVARSQPQQAEALLSTIDPAAMFREARSAHPQLPPLYCASCRVLPQICIQMAAADPKRAERIARRLFVSLEGVATPGAQPAQTGSNTAGVDPPELISDVEIQLLKAVTLARMAERAVETDRDRARRWLEEAVGGLAASRRGTMREDWFHAAAAVIATLVPLAEHLDPALAHELFWRSLALRVPRSPGEGRAARAHDSNLSKLAQMLARYDLDVARQLLSTLVENNRGEFLAWSPGNYVQIRVDSDALLASARKFAETPFDESSVSRERLRLDVAARLASVQNQIARDWPDYLFFELELIRESLGLDFHHPRLEE